MKFGINFPITLLLGIRRSGKSSLVKVLMREIESVWVYLDLRRFEVRSYITYSDLVRELEGALDG